MMGDTQENKNLTGQPIRADGWYGHTDGLHTVVIQTVNFSGHVYIEASLELEPKEGDWFPIKLSQNANYIQFPQNPFKPTGDQDSGGDTGAFGITFKVNALWLRARMDREYLNLTDSFANINILERGVVSKITLAR